MALTQSSMNRFTRARPESADPFAMQLALSRVHARLVPMDRDELGYALDPSARGWLSLDAERGFAGYGLGRALRMLLDVLRGLTALHDTFDAQGVNFAHGEVALKHLRIDGEGVCRLLPLTARHSDPQSRAPTDALGYLAPERLLGESVDVRADVFSAGVLLWEALAGRRLFNETDADAIVDRLMAGKLQMPQLPPELAWAIPLKLIAARALSVDPYQRFADCAELATAIAIVARDRVAAHAEIAAFFGPLLRSTGSVAQPRPVPTRSSTFPSVNLPAAPVSVSAPSSRNGFPLATPAARPVTPIPRRERVTSVPRSITPTPLSAAPTPPEVTPVPRRATLPPGAMTAEPRRATLPPGAMTAEPRRATLPPGAMTAEPRRATLPPRALTPVPSSVPSPEAPRSVMPKSPFATLIGIGEVVPASHRRKTLTSVGTPASATTRADAAAASAPPSSRLPPPLPLSTASAFNIPALAAPRSLARATLNSIALGEVAQFRSWSPRRAWIALAAVAVVGIVIALIASSGSSDAPEAKPVAAQQPIKIPTPMPPPPAPEPVATAEDPLHSAPAPRSVTEPNGSAPRSAPKELRPVNKPAALPSNVGSSSNTRDYGI